MKFLFKNIFYPPSQNEDEAPFAGEPAGSASKRSEKPSLQGEIAAIALDDIFQLFDFAGLTGELEVRKSGNTGYFFFKKGVLVFGMLSKNRQRLGEILVAEGCITPEQLDECLALHKENRERRLGNILQEQGYVKEDDLAEFLGRQVKSAVFEALSWKEGTFFFYSNQAPGKEEVLLRERVDHLLLEGMVHIDDNTEDEEAPPIEEIF